MQDAGDIILTGHARGSWEFLLHHALVSLVSHRHYPTCVMVLFTFWSLHVTYLSLLSLNACFGHYFTVLLSLI